MSSLTKTLPTKIFNALLYSAPAALVLGIIDFRFSNYFWEGADAWRWIDGMAMFDLFSIFEMYVWVLFAAWILMATFFKEYRPDRQFRISYLIIAFIAIGLAVAKFFYVAHPESVRSFWFQALVGYVNPVLLFGVLVFSLKERLKYRRFLMAWLWTFGVFGLVVLFQGLTGLLPGEAYDYLGRLTWPYIDPFFGMKAQSANWLTFLFGPTFVLAAASLVAYRGKGAGRRLMQGLCVSVALIAFVVLLMTKSYTGILVALVLFGYLIFVNIPRRLWKWFFVGLGILLVVGVSTQIESRKFQILLGNDTQDSSIHRRVQIYELSYRAFEDYPLAGIGPGNYQGFFRDNVAGYLGEAGESFPQIEVPPHPHNLIINFWSDLGVFGLMAIALIYFIVGYRVFIQREPNLVLLVLIYLLVHGLLDLPYGTSENSALFWITMALVTRHSSFGKGK